MLAYRGQHGRKHNGTLAAKWRCESPFGCFRYNLRNR